MWIFLNNAFISMVEHREQPDSLMIRARSEGDIERLFNDAEVTETPTADYRFRATVTKQEAAAAISSKVQSIDYDNFKNSVDENDRHDAYLGVWSVMHGYQNRR